MSVPEEIRNVPRPKNTVVVDTKTNGPKRYAVRERSEYKSSKNKNPSPRNGKIIGHIINGKFLRLKRDITAVSQYGYERLQYGAAALVYYVSSDILEDLYECFSIEDAHKLMSIAALRVINPGIACNRYKIKQEMSYLSIFYPCRGLSKNSVSEFLKNLGKAPSKLREFYLRRFKRVTPEDHVIIDGMLKQDTGDNTLSKSSAKTHLKGHDEISVIYAYSLENQEVICSKVYQGNMLDAKAFEDFIVSNHIFKGIIVCDKGFPVSEIEHILEAYPDLHYIIPLKRNDKRIKEYDLLNFDSSAEKANGDQVLFKKTKVAENKFFYGFRNETIAIRECFGKINKSIKNGGDFDACEYFENIASQGSIVFESDMDCHSMVILDGYDNRWSLESVFDHFKNTLDLDITNVHEKSSIIGNEFINYLTVLITCRIGKAFKAVDAKFKSTPGYSLKAKIADLSDIDRDADAPLIGSLYDGCWNLPAKNSSMILLGRLGLIEDYPEEGIDLKKINEFTTQYDIVNPEDNCKCEDLSQLKVNPLKDHVVDKLKRNAVSQAKKSRKKAEAEFENNFVGPLPKRKVGRPKGSVNRKNTEFEKNLDSMTMSASGVSTPVSECQPKPPIEADSTVIASKELLNDTQDRPSNASMTMSASGVSTPVSECQPKPPIEADLAVIASKELLNDTQDRPSNASMTMSSSGVSTPVSECQSKPPIEADLAVIASKELLNDTQDRPSNASMTMSSSGVSTPVSKCQPKPPIEADLAVIASKELLNDTQDRPSNASMTMSSSGVSTPVSECQSKPPIEADSTVIASKKLLNNSQYGQTFASGCVMEDVYDFDNDVQFEHQLCDSQYDANSYQEMNCTGVSREDVMWFE